MARGDYLEVTVSATDSSKGDSCEGKGARRVTMDCEGESGRGDGGWQVGGQWTVGKWVDGGWRRMLSGTVVDGEAGGITYHNSEHSTFQRAHNLLP